MEKVVIKESNYNVKTGKIIRTKQMTEYEKLFEIALEGGTSLDHEPGQFIMLSVFGVGEIPISISSSPATRGSFDICVRAVGKVTTALHRLEAGDVVGIRGPYGRGFPIRILEGNDLLIVAGGLGIAPLRSLIKHVLFNRRDFGKVHILLGCKSPKDMLFVDELEQWNSRMDVYYECTVDRAAPDWAGNVGLITTLIPGVHLEPERTFAIIVGPPIMYKFVIRELLAKNIPERQIILSFERHMKCGMGKCGRCQIQGLYVCQDGPVFNYADIKQMSEAL
ncbi:MAG TPA: FAD/NAD(P)-binding protein [Thermodesulfovibrionales bacterium]|nr:FAD/NAD(P)-binding protein [Thermodesulfovibrionales bacterium]